VTFYEQVIGCVATLVCVSAFICALVLYFRAGRGARVAIVVLSWVLTVVLYRVVFSALPDDGAMGWIGPMGLVFVFAFAFWGVIDLVLHSKVRLGGGETARFAQGAGLLVFSAALFVATYFVPDTLDALPFDAGFGLYFLGILGAALAGVLSFRAGARAVYANRSAVPGLLAARNATVEVVPEKGTYAPGETVLATVRLRGKKDFEVDDARAEILYTNRYSYLTPDVRGGSLLIEAADREVVGTEPLPTGGTVRKDKTAEDRVSLVLPADAPPTGEGEITGVAWVICVVMSVPGGPDVRAEAPITVISTRDTYGERSGREQEPASSRSVEMRLQPAGRDLRPGERVEGRLAVTPRGAFEAREVRVELARREIVRRDAGNHQEVVVARETVAGRTRFHPRTSQGYAFGLVVPEDTRCLSSETAHTYVGWFLRAEIDRGTYPAHAVELELNVYGEPQDGLTA
jgi:hypothetical protein